MNNRSLPKVSRRTFIGLGAATVTAAAWNSVRWQRAHARLIALNFGGLSDASRLGQLELWLKRYPDVSVTLLPTLQQVETLLAADATIWQRWAAAGHEIGFAAGNGQLSAEFLQWRSRLGPTITPRFATDLRNAPSRALATHSARHGMLVAAWQTMHKMPSAQQVTTQQSVLISAAALDLAQLDQLLTTLIEQNRQLVTLSTLMRSNRGQIEPLEVDAVAQPQAYDWLY